MELEVLKRELDVSFEKIATEEDCATFFAKYLSKTGEVNKLTQSLRDIAPEKRGEFGAMVNELKRGAETRFFKLQTQIKEDAKRAKLMQDPVVDITIPDTTDRKGSLHPITLIMREVEDVFSQMGFIIEQGPEIVTEYENFDSLNTPKSHPGRDMQDTFYLNDGRMLRTQTSARQNYILKKYGPEFKAICAGRTYRNEAVDFTHDCAFFQVEGMMVGKDVSIANLIYFMKEALTAIFKKDIKVRLRPGFFPFVEPGFELDASCPFCGGSGCPRCKGMGWMEFCGCGMVHPEVLREGGVDPEKYQGFAFGFGLTRLAMMRYNVEDIRLFNGGNLDFLRGIK